MKDKLKKFTLFCFSLALIAFALNLIADNPYMHRLVRLAIDTQVKAETNLTVDFKAVKISVVPPGIELYGLAVAPNSAPDVPILTVSQLRSRLSLWALVLGHFRLRSIELNDPTLTWPPAGDFHGILKDATPATKEPEKPDQPLTWPPKFVLPINAIALNNAKIFVESPLFRMPEAPHYSALAVAGLDVDLRYRSWTDMQLEISAKTLDAALGPSSLLESTTLQASAKLVGTHVAIEQLKLDGDRIHLSSSADVDLVVDGGSHAIERVRSQLAGVVHGDLSLLGSYLDLADTHGAVDGKFTLHTDIPVTATGKASFLVEGDGQVHEARLAGFRLFNSSTTFAIDEKSVRFPAIDLVIGDTSVGKASGEIKLDDAVHIDFKAHPKALHLTDLLEALGVDTRLVDTTIDGQDIRAKGTGSPFKLDVTADAKIADIAIQNLPENHARFPHAPSCQAQLRLAVNALALDFSGTKATCSGFTEARANLVGPPAPPEPAGRAPAGNQRPGEGSPAAPDPDRAVAKAGPALSHIDISGKILLNTAVDVDVQVRSNDLDLSLAQNLIQQPLSGQGSVNIRVHGPVERIHVDGQFAQQNVAVLGLNLGTATGGIDIVGTNVGWHSVKIELTDGGDLVSKSGHIDFGKDGYPAQLALEASQLPETFTTEVANLAQDSVVVESDINHLALDFTGPLLHPAAGKGLLEAHLSHMSVDDETLFDDLRTTLRGDAHGWSTHDLAVSRGSLVLDVKFDHHRTAPWQDEVRDANRIWHTVGLGPKDKLKIAITAEHSPPAAGAAADAATEDSDSDDSNLRDQLAQLPYAGRYLAAVEMKGQIALNAELSATSSQLQGSFTGSLQSPAVMGSTMAPINVRGFVHNSQLDLVFDHSGNALEGRLSVNVLAPGIPYEWFINCNRLDLRVLGSDLFHGDARNYLYFTGDWRMKGHFTDWWHSVGELNIGDVRANYVHDSGALTNTVQVRQDQPAKVLFTDQGWRFADSKGLVLSGRNLLVHLGMVDSRPPEHLGLKIESVIDLAIAKDILPDVDTAEGKVKIVGTVFGSTAAPNPTVEITDLKPSRDAQGWKPLSLGLADIRPAFRNINMHLVYRDGRFNIDKLRADKGTGSISASGQVNVGGTSGDTSHLDVTLNDASVVYPVAFLKSFETQMSGNLVISGQGLPLKVAGDIVINKARSTREVDIRDEIINALRQKSISSGVAAEKPTLLFDLNITANHTINIHNRNLQAQLSTDLHLKGSDIAPVVTGQVQADKGKFIYKQEFNITRGLVTFDDPIKPDPSLDILAVADVDIYRVYIAITGRASNPTVEFSVDPATRESGTAISKLEILVLLSRGKLPEEQQTQGQQTQNAATSEAANLLLGQFEEPVEKLLDASGQNVVRNIYIDTHPAPDGSPVPRLNLPIDLGDSIDLVVRTDQDTTEASLEYNINESIGFSGVKEFQHSKDQQPTQPTPGDIEGDSRLNLKFRFSFE